MTRPPPAHDERSPVRRKSTLFCWGCGHESPVDDDWNRRVQDRHVEYVCPVCETTITKRPLPDGNDRERTIPVAWQRTLRTTMRVWRASISVGVSSATAVADSSSTADRRR
ncbi:hypothetical protein [Natronorubrum halophilum]|uniref:hypothetical protein n=1 Tax=Natronorubrum halophilum TaxID=1702106 RepID=UPI000EF6472A|nr:hypothetical protein [Natronorubrum halophilum]